MEAETERCELCSGNDITFTTPQQWNSEGACSVATSLALSLTSLVCQACRRDISRVSSDPSFISRWEKIKFKGGTCVIQNCTTEVFVSTKLFTLEKFHSAVLANGLSAVEVSSPIPLCHTHYNQVYHYLFPTQSNCASCGISLKHTQVRSCPDPTVIEEHLREKTGFEGHIRNTDKVCNSCYNSHLAILKQQTNTSRDSDLAMLIETISKTLRVEDIKSADSMLYYAIQKTIVTVGEKLLNKDIILLATAHDTFCQHVADAHDLVDIEVEQWNLKEVVTAQCLLGHLISNLSHHVAYSCRVRKYGTLIYRPNTDFVQALSKLLWEQRRTNAVQQPERPKKSSNDHTNITSSVLNGLVHQEVNRHLEEEKIAPYDFDEVNIDELIEQSDQTLWKAICTMTRSVRDAKSKVEVTNAVQQPECPKKSSNDWFGSMPPKQYVQEYFSFQLTLMSTT